MGEQREVAECAGLGRQGAGSCTPGGDTRESLIVSKQQSDQSTPRAGWVEVAIGRMRINRLGAIVAIQAEIRACNSVVVGGWKERGRTEGRIDNRIFGNSPLTAFREEAFREEAGSEMTWRF